MEIRIPFGRSSLTAVLPGHLAVDLLEAPDVPAAAEPLKVVEAALDDLTGDVSWSRFVGAKSVGIAINDKTRPVPHGELLPPLLTRLAGLGIPDDAITLYIAVGTHTPMKPDEYPSILPPAIRNTYTVCSHNSEDDSKLDYLGETSGGTRVWSNKDYLQSDLKIVVGNIEPHHFVGFSGGVKTAAIGLSGYQTITQNHALMTHPDSLIGEYQTNPARQDIEEIGQMIGVDLALNAILNHHRQIVVALAGDPYHVMKVGIPFSRQVCQVAVPDFYGLMIVSPGGYPKDINVYQAQKGLKHSALVTRSGGTIILAAACPEGPGSQHYEEWMVGKRSYGEVIQKFNTEGFRIGPHKAYLIARDASKINLRFYSEMDAEISDNLLLNPVLDFQAAIDEAVVGLEPGERIGVMPHATSTIPFIKH
jgi:nickel-dependent lactate racemase